MERWISPAYCDSCRTEMPAISVPSQFLAELDATASRFVTEHPGGQLVWRRWSEIPEAGAPLLLLHGGFGSWTHWVANLPVLRKSRTVWTLDLPGLGESDLDDPPHTTERFALCLWQGLQQLPGLTTFETVGFSFGAMIGGHLALLAGEACRRFTAIGAAGFGELHQQVALLPPPAPGAPASDVEAVTRENLARLMIHNPKAIDNLAVYVHADNLARHRFRSRKLAGSNDLGMVLTDIQAPLCGIWGAEDATAGGAQGIEARRDLFTAAQSGAAFHILPDVGHWAMYEAPVLINALLLEPGAS